MYKLKRLSSLFSPKWTNLALSVDEKHVYINACMKCCYDISWPQANSFCASLWLCLHNYILVLQCFPPMKAT